MTALRSMTRKTSIWWPLRVWMGVEVFFGVAAILTIFLRPQFTATNFAWPIKPDVMAATLGAFYLASAIIFVLPLFARHWQNVRVMIIPVACFSTAMLIATVLHWDKFSVGSRPFYVWFASYVLPPPIFLGLYWQHQRRSIAVGAEVLYRLPSWVQRFLCCNGLGVTAIAVVLYLFPAILIAIAPWKFTPLTTRTLCGWLIGIGLIQLWMAWENDWHRIKLGTTMLLVLPFTLVIQLLRFSPEVQWHNFILWVFLVDVALTAIVLGTLWQSPPQRLNTFDLD
jgi:hypothetical protein